MSSLRESFKNTMKQRVWNSDNNQTLYNMLTDWGLFEYRCRCIISEGVHQGNDYIKRLDEYAESVEWDRLISETWNELRKEASQEVHSLELGFSNPRAERIVRVFDRFGESSKSSLTSCTG